MPDSPTLALVKHLFADGAYDRRALMDKAAYKDFVIAIIRRIEGGKARSRAATTARRAHLGWMARWRRLVRD